MCINMHIDWSTVTHKRVLHLITIFLPENIYPLTSTKIYRKEYEGKSRRLGPSYPLSLRFNNEMKVSRVPWSQGAALRDMNCYRDVGKAVGELGKTEC